MREPRCAAATPLARLLVAIVAVSLLSTGVQCSAPTQSESGKWGTNITPQECKAAGGRVRTQKILSGALEPYAFNGPPEDCDEEGCRHLYWGPRCRFTGTEAPACPRESRDGLVKMLKDYATNGASWATDALTLQPCELFEEIKGHTLWFVGDSVSQETAHTFLCFLVEYMETAKPAPRISTDKHLMHRLTHNANNAEMTTWCGLMKERTRICMLRVNFGPRMAGVMLPALAQITDPQDIVVLNFGLWSNGIEELRMHASVFEAAFEFHRERLPNRTFWRETSAQHYSTPTGMYDIDTPISQQRCRPIYPGRTNLTIAVNGSLIPMPGSFLPPPASEDDKDLSQVMEGGLRNLATQPSVDRLGLHTIRTWNTSMALWMFHHHVHQKDEPQTCAAIDCDCTHACQPSWSQIWLPGFLRAFKDRSLYMRGGKADWREDGPDLAAI